jgi:hypothetical protein
VGKSCPAMKLVLHDTDIVRTVSLIENDEMILMSLQMDSKFHYSRIVYCVISVFAMLFVMLHIFRFNDVVSFTEEQ